MLQYLFLMIYLHFVAPTTKQELAKSRLHTKTTNAAKRTNHAASPTPRKGAMATIDSTGVIATRSAPSTRHDGPNLDARGI